MDDGYPSISRWMDMDTVSPNPDGYGSTFAPMDIHPYPSIPSSGTGPTYTSSDRKTYVDQACQQINQIKLDPQFDLI
jgi:hypothetical protein